MNLDALAKLKVDSPCADANLASIVISFQNELTRARQAITERAASLSRDLLWALWHIAPPGISVDARGLGASSSLAVCGINVCGISPSVFDGKPFSSAYYGISRNPEFDALRGLGDEELVRLNEAVKGYFNLQLQLGHAGVSNREFRFSYGPRAQT
ncbi:hypothetical protein AB4Y45_34110 [Paraburkholderia sp. EG287A]|uniref:hypothetical protein n=1 Tax=Paraburkholderia sp. EG287A TaxID=3237012 RepID=UPI0034D22EB6